MIVLTLNKSKLVSLILITELIDRKISMERIQLEFSLKRGEITAHRSVLKVLIKKLIIRMVLKEHLPEHKIFRLSIDYMQAYVIILYKDLCINDLGDYEMATVQELSEPMFKRLLN